MRWERLVAGMERREIYIIQSCFCNYAKALNTLRGYNVKISNIKADNTHSHQFALKWIIIAKKAKHNSCRKYHYKVLTNKLCHIDTYPMSEVVCQNEIASK
jgi:hypothetical protein